MEMDSMATLTKPRPKVKTEVVTNDLFPIADGSTGLLLTTVCGTRGTTALYRVTRLTCADVAFRLSKFSFEAGSDPEDREYCVNLSDDTCGCSCKGYAAHGHCKHHAATAALVREGRLS
jgi:hypothetical protein